MPWFYELSPRYFDTWKDYTSQLSTFSFVCISKDWKCLKTELIGCQKENGNDAEEKLDSTLTRCPKLITSESQMDFVYLGTLCDTLKKTHYCFCCTQGRDRPSESAQEETSDNPKMRTILFFQIGLYSSKVSVSSERKTDSGTAPNYRRLKRHDN